MKNSFNKFYNKNFLKSWTLNKIFLIKKIIIRGETFLTAMSKNFFAKKNPAKLGCNFLKFCASILSIGVKLFLVMNFIIEIFKIKIFLKF